MLSQGKEGKVDDGISLDVHAITELQNQKIPLTDDSPKYNYKAKSTDKITEYGTSNNFKIKAQLWFNQNGAWM